MARVGEDASSEGFRLSIKKDYKIMNNHFNGLTKITDSVDRVIERRCHSEVIGCCPIPRIGGMCVEVDARAGRMGVRPASFFGGGTKTYRVPIISTLERLRIDTFCVSEITRNISRLETNPPAFLPSLLFWRLTRLSAGQRIFSEFRISEAHSTTICALGISS